MYKIWSSGHNMSSCKGKKKEVGGANLKGDNDPKKTKHSKFGKRKKKAYINCEMITSATNFLIYSRLEYFDVMVNHEIV